MRISTIGGIIILVALAIVGVQAYKNEKSKPIIIKQEGRSNQPAPPQLKWIFTSAGEDAASGAPFTKVTLQAGDKTHELGVYQGSCSEIKDSSWGLLENEQEGAICWWAGGGTEIGIFKEGEKLIVKKGAIEEGTAEGGGFRGNFKTLVEL